MENKFDFNKLIKPVPPRAVLKMKNWVVWGGSVVFDDGKYHMYFSRWPKGDKHKGWITDSEIAYAVSDDPLGPFEFQKTIIGKRGQKYWDADMAHNPNILKWKNKFYLYYTGNYGNGEFWIHRNNQRIGVAVSDNPEGPWKRFDKPILDIDQNGWDSLFTTNPSCCPTPDGGLILIYKAATDKKNTHSQDCPVAHGVAFAKDPVGPFQKKPDPIFKSGKAKFPGEDPYVFYHNDCFYTILKDMGGYYTDHKRALVLFESDDGINWELASMPLVTTRKIKFENKKVEEFQRLERPQILKINDKLSVLYCAAKEKQKKYAYNIHIPLREN